jgi:Flp pilus assembly protein TadG
MVFVAIAIVVLIGFAALAIDIGHLFVVRNELKNAADAGALAGAQVLYNNNGTAINPSANDVALEAATANRSEKFPVEVDVTADPPDIQRGHWSFTTGTFTANETVLLPPPLWNVSTYYLDTNLDPTTIFINAVRVKTRREATPAVSFFARIFGFENFKLSAESVAYRGFAGSILPGDVDQPIAICRQSIIDSNENYTCGTGRMIDSGSGVTHNTAAWTNFSQPCATASVPTVTPLVCAEKNPEVMINYGEGIGTTGGMQDTVYRDLRDCWLNNPHLAKDDRGYPMERWSLALPVIDCPGNNVGPCSTVLGVVYLNFIWIKQANADPNWMDIPLQMNGWDAVGASPPVLDWHCSLGININSLTVSQRQQCWGEFATHFNLQSADGTSVGDLTAAQIQKTMVFVPDCEYHELAGNTGGINFGVLARNPVLVK